MKKILIAALMAAFAATALPGAAVAQERDRSILLPLAGGLGTANWFLRPTWTHTFKISKFKHFKASAPSGFASGGYRHHRHSFVG